MFTTNSETIIYVHAPAGSATGGIELLHQLVDYLRNNGKNAYIVYHGNSDERITLAYSKYIIKICKEGNICNQTCNIEVYPEVYFNYLYHNNRKTQKLFWWLSVDNFYKSNVNLISLIDIFLFDKNEAWGMLKHRAKMLLKYHKNEFADTTSLFFLQAKGIRFAYQCYYIKHSLNKHGVFRTYPLMDYINTEYIKDFNKERRDNIVLYNPSKGFDFTKQLISIAPDIKWVALKGFTREQLVQLLQNSKLYIDFGNHPGKDRLPRECAMNGCCIITGKRGAARYYEDVMIPSKYKFDESIVDKNVIIDKIRFVLNNYEKVIDDFDSYRKKIKTEKAEFEKQIEILFNLKSK